MVGLVQQITSRTKKTKTLLLAVFLIFTAYLIYDSFIYFLNPYSGRISTLECKENFQEQSICTVTIYGVRDTYRREFQAEDFQKAIRISNVHGTSDTWACGVSIVTSKEQINFVHQNQKCHIADEVAGQINKLFISGGYAPSARNIQIGFNSSFYRRGILLVAVLLLAFLTSRSRRFVPVSDVTHNVAGRFRQFAFYWFRSNFLVRLFFYLAIAFILAIWSFWYPTAQADFTRSCGHVFRYCYECPQFPFNYLLCVYPLLTILVIQALVQRQLLINSKVSVSMWWVAAPVLASFSLMILSPELTCNDCQLLKYLMSGILSDFDAQIRFDLIIYFLIVGLIQWLVICRNLSSSVGWVIMPLINAMLVTLSYMFLYYSEMVFGLLLIPLTLIISDIIPGIHMSWLIHIKNNEAAIS